jgi:pilus assembly protein Flp/PilA
MAQHMKHSSKPQPTAVVAAPGLGLQPLKELVMSTLTSAVKTFINDENGVTAIEYGLIAALIATALVTAVTYITGALDFSFDKIADEMKGTA